MVTNKRGLITPTKKEAVLVTLTRTSPLKAKVFLIKIIVVLVKTLTLPAMVVLHSVRFATNLDITPLNAYTALTKLFKTLRFLKLLQFLPSTTPPTMSGRSWKEKQRKILTLIL